ncbi:hypothetical protein ACFL6C_04350 [Myxococcota bacterium]
MDIKPTDRREIKPIVVDEHGPEKTTEASETDTFVLTARSTTPSAAKHEADLRLERFNQIMDKVDRIEGADPDFLRNYLTTSFTAMTPPVEDVLPDPLNERELAAQLELGHPHATLELDDFTLLSSMDLPEPLVGSFTTLGVYTNRETRDPLAYFIVTFSRTADGKASQYLDYLFTNIHDPHAVGITDRFLEQLERLSRTAGVTEETIWAAAVGRLRWALDGYDFESEKEKADLVCRFKQFLKRFEIHEPEFELEFDRGDGTVEPFSFDKLEHSWDFAHVRSKRRSIRIATRVGHTELPIQRLPVGRAFLLGDYEDPEIKDIVSPCWHGVRSVDPSSPGQIQRRRYQAIRERRKWEGA